MGIFIPAWKSKDENKRVKWLERRANPRKSKHREIISQLALNDKSMQVRSNSLWRIKDENLLWQIASNDVDYYVRQVAYKQLRQENSQEALSDIAKNDSYYKNRQEAYKKLGQENCLEALIDVIKNGYSEQDRQAAAEKITDQDTQVEIAKNSKDYIIRKIAIGKMSDISALGECLAVEERQNVSKWFAAPLPKGRTSQIVDAWMREHEGQRVRITFDAIVDGYTYEDVGLWTIIPPVSFDPLTWELSVVNAFWSSPQKEVLCLSVTEDVALVNISRPYSEKKFVPAYHEAEMSSDYILYRIAFGGSSYESGNDSISYSGPTMRQENITLWQKYRFELLVK